MGEHWGGLVLGQTDENIAHHGTSPVIWRCTGGSTTRVAMIVMVLIISTAKRCRMLSTQRAGSQSSTLRSPFATSRVTPNSALAEASETAPERVVTKGANDR